MIFIEKIHYNMGLFEKICIFIIKKCVFSGFLSFPDSSRYNKLVEEFQHIENEEDCVIMPNIKTKPTKDFTSIRNTMIRDKRLNLVDKVAEV